MLSVFICEDNPAQREQIERIIRNFIMIEALDMRLALVTADPMALLNHVQQHQPHGIYFLDVDLNHEMNGIKLGSTIRNIDTEGKIVFITTHNEMVGLTFTYKVEAMDYISKDDPADLKVRIKTALLQAQNHYHHDPSPEDQRIKLKIGNQLRVFPLEEIMFVETAPTPHKLVLHLTNSTVDFYGKISELPALSPRLFKVHKSYVANLDNITTLDKKQGTITLANGETCLLASRQLKKIQERL